MKGISTVRLYTAPLVTSGAGVGMCVFCCAPWPKRKTLVRARVALETNGSVGGGTDAPPPPAHICAHGIQTITV